MTARTALRCTLALLASLFLSTAAHAQLFRAYVASGGNDANACTLAAPCRLLPAALTAVATGGEIWMLDSANYNSATVTVGKSVSILAVPGAVGSVVALGGPAISITADSLKVALRNLVIVPFPGGGGTHGVSMTGASTLTIEHSLIANLNGDGVHVVGGGTLKIANTIFRNGHYAVYLENGATAEISGTQMLAHQNGGVIAYGTAAATTTASVSDSTVSGADSGFASWTNVAGAVTRIVVTRCTIESTNTGLNTATNGLGSAIIAVSNTMITNNNYAWIVQGTGSVIRTLGNNHITDNNTSGGALTLTALQ
jgi:hypothetical protein